MFDMLSIRRLSLGLSTATTLLCTPIGAQTILIVHKQNGPYTTIQTAVNAANAGDLIEVRGGGSYAGATISKGVQIYGATRFDLTSNFVVSNLPRGQHAGLANFRTRRYNTAGCSVKITNCAGTVQLRAIEGYGSGLGPALDVNNSANVTATDCAFASNSIVVWTRIADIGGSVSVSGSSLSLRRCSTIGRLHYGWSGRATVYHSFAGIAAAASRIVMVDCVATGGGGYYWTGPFGRSAIPGNPGVDGSQRSLLVVKRLTATGGGHPTGGFAPGVRADALGRIFKDTATNVTVGGPVTTQDIYDLDATGSAPGGTVPITVKGKGLVAIAVFVSNPAIPVVGPPVGIWLDLRSPVLLYADALNGVHTTRVTTPKHLPLGLTVCLQAAVLTKRGLETSTPAVISLR